jgi:hypothetical protein
MGQLIVPVVWWRSSYTGTVEIFDFEFDHNSDIKLIANQYYILPPFGKIRCFSFMNEMYLDIF